MLSLAFVGAAASPGFRCVGISSPELRQQIVATAPVDREVALLPRLLTEEDARALAAACHADLSRVGQRWRLYRRPSTEAALRKADREWLLACAGKTAARLDRLALRYADSGVDAPLAALRATKARLAAHRDLPDLSGIAASELTPASHLMADLLRRPSAGILDALPGTSTVLSSAPVELESVLDAPTEPFDTYLKAQARFAQRSEAATQSGLIPEAYLPEFPRGPFRPGNRTYRLTIYRWGLEPTFSLAVFDPSGDSEATATATTQGVEEATLPSVRPLTSLGRVEMPVQSPSSSGRSAPPDPLANDPLDATVREALVLWAKAKGHGRVVACVPDTLFERVPRCISGGSLDLDRLTQEIDRADCETLMAGDDLVVRPKHPLQEEATRVDRRPLSALWHAANEGRFGFEDLLAYHAAYLVAYEQPAALLQRTETSIWSGFDLSSANRSLPHALLATLGTIPEIQRRRASSGAHISLQGDAYADCRSALARYAQAHATDPGDDEIKKALGASRVLLRDRATVVGSALDRTEEHLLARPGARELEVVASRTVPVVRRIANNGQPLDRDFLSTSVVIRELDRDTMGHPDPSGCRVVWAPLRTTTVRVRLGDGVVIGPYDLRERGPESAGAVSLDQVPGVVIPRRPPP